MCKRPNRALPWTVSFSCVIVLFVPAAMAAPGPCVVDPMLGNPVYVELQTTAGDIALELWPDIAPCTINNFFAYIDSGRYDGTFIHRSVDNFVIQGGGYAYDSGTNSFASIPRDPAVINEPGASNLTGTIAMARVGGQVNSATSEFFINLADNTGLDSVDQGFTVFGRVADAHMPIVYAIGTLPRIVGRWSLNSALREIFGELPLHALPSEAPGGYGCFDPNETPETGLSGWSRALINLAGNALEPDPLTGAEYFLSRSCSGVNAIAPPSVACTTSRMVAYSSLGSFFLDPTAMTCEAIAESEESLAARRDGQQPKVGANLVELTTVAVPEPSSTLLLLTGVVGIAGSSRWRRLHRPLGHRDRS